MLHVVVYDIEDEGVRRRVASALEGYGRRVQESVFECRVDEDGLRELTARLQRELKRPDNGQIRFYRVCGNCLQASFGLGEIAPPENKDCYIV
ncbi:MAG: CRISPR-associated endonuclease Cas2 [Acidobacteria bacterium]|nr:CRISPR-associated endonuclease Cas2 [Acidobacteriota bacterium]